MTEREAEMQALCTRAATEEARRQQALERGDRQAAADAEIELSRLWSRYVDLGRQGEAA